MHQNLSNGKSPGPDGIVNELLGILPHEILGIIHKVFVIMWDTRITPTSWKTSITILIDKNKGAETYFFLQAHRSSQHPIQVVDTPCHQHPLRVCWSTLHAQYYASRLPKPKGHHTPAFKCHHEPWGWQAFLKWHLCPYCWHTSAFNTTDHDRMLWIMYDLSFQWYCQKPV